MYLFFFLSSYSFSLCREDAKNPSFWSRVCLHNMVLLAREATTKRRILESLFIYIDNGNLWSPENGLAFPVLRDMQLSGENSGIYAKLSLLMIIFQRSCPVYLSIDAI